MRSAWDDVESLADVDVAVIGSGSAGAAAAISAARTGASVLLIEKLPFLGGNSTAVLDTFYGFYTPGERARKIVGGIADEVVDELNRIGTTLERPNTYGAGTGVTYNPDHLKVVWESLVRGAGARVLLHCFVQDVRTDGDRCEEVLVATKAGLRRISATMFVDATGESDLVHRAGAGFEQAGVEAPSQTLTTTFRLANVDTERRKTISKDELHALMRTASTEGYDLPRREGSDHITTISGMTSTVMTRVAAVADAPSGGLVTVSDPWFLSDAEQEGRRQALEYVRFLVDRVPGYENASLAGLAVQIGIRESRRVHGDYRVTREDVLSARQFDDQIALCGAPIEDHRPGEGTDWAYLPDGAAVGIPLRSLIVRDLSNVVVAGRNFSATHDAHASIRSMAQCMAMGHAAGLTSGLAARSTGSPRDVAFTRVRSELTAAGAILELDA